MPTSYDVAANRILRPLVRHYPFSARTGLYTGYAGVWIAVIKQTLIDLMKQKPGWRYEDARDSINDGRIRLICDALGIDFERLLARYLTWVQTKEVRD